MTRARLTVEQARRIVRDGERNARGMDAEEFRAHLQRVSQAQAIVDRAERASAVK